MSVPFFIIGAIGLISAHWHSNHYDAHEPRATNLKHMRMMKIGGYGGMVSLFVGSLIFIFTGH